MIRWIGLFASGGACLMEIKDNFQEGSTARTPFSSVLKQLKNKDCHEQPLLNLIFKTNPRSGNWS
jgi:hypothetical protein